MLQKPWRYEEDNFLLEEDNAVFTVDEVGAEVAGMYGYRCSTQQEFIEFVHSNSWKKRVKLVGGSLFKKLVLVFENLLNLCYLQKTSYVQWRKNYRVKKRTEICLYTAVLPMESLYQMQTTNVLSRNKSSKSINSTGNNDAHGDTKTPSNVDDEFFFQHELKKKETEDFNKKSFKIQSTFENAAFEIFEDFMFIIDDYCELNEFLTRKHSTSKCRVYKMQDRLEEYKITTFIDQVKKENTEEKPKKKQKNDKPDKKKFDKKKLKKELVSKVNQNDPQIPLLQQYQQKLDIAYSTVEGKLLEPRDEASSKKKNLAKETKSAQNDKTEKVVKQSQESIKDAVKAPNPLISYCEQVTDICHEEIEPYVEDVMLPPTCRSETLWHLSSDLKFETFDVHQKVPIQDVLTDSEMLDCLAARLTSDELKSIYELGKSVFPESESSSVSCLNDQQNEEKSEKKKKSQKNKSNSNNNPNKAKTMDKNKSGQRINSEYKDSKNEKTQKSEKLDEKMPTSTRYGMKEVVEAGVTTSVSEKHHLQRFVYEAVQRYHVCQVFNSSLDASLSSFRIISFSKWL